MIVLLPALLAFVPLLALPLQEPEEAVAAQEDDGIDAPQEAEESAPASAVPS